MLPAGALAVLAEACQDRGIGFISDEIYHGIIYGTEATSFAGREEMIVANSFSKCYCMAG